ncbi:hypothetical protein [Pseudomonas sp. RIT-To-2]|uniref:hypothetical protein n=1 Tax=Pseudomonas sp. RIT-To-2 TaxID=3462541 RepID=UPI002413AC53
MNPESQARADFKNLVRQRLVAPFDDPEAVIYHSDFSRDIDDWAPMWIDVALSVRDRFLLTTRDAKDDYAYCHSFRSVSVTAGSYLLIGEMKVDSPTFIFGGFGAWSGNRTIAWVLTAPSKKLERLNVTFNVPADGVIELEFGAYARMWEETEHMMSSWLKNVSLIRIND